MCSSPVLFVCSCVYSLYPAEFMFSPATAGRESAVCSSSACIISASGKAGDFFLNFFFIVRDMKNKQNPNRVLNPSMSLQNCRLATDKQSRPGASIVMKKDTKSQHCHFYQVIFRIELSYESFSTRSLLLGVVLVTSHNPT